MYILFKIISIVCSNGKFVNNDTGTTYIGKRLSTCSKTKDKTKFEHQHDIIYHVRCSAENCPDDYIGEAARRVVERVKDHGGRDTKSHMFKHSIEKEHKEVTQSDFKIIGSHF